MNMIITSITLPAGTVHAALETYLNANVFRTPMRITSVESDGETYSVALEPAPGPTITAAVWTYAAVGAGRVSAATPAPTTPPIIDLIEACYAATAHNGHQPAAESVGSGLVSAATPDLSPDGRPAPVPTGAPKSSPRSGNRTSPEIAARVLALSAAGELSVHKIALATGVSDSTVYAIRLEARQAAAAASTDGAHVAGDGAHVTGGDA